MKRYSGDPGDEHQEPVANDRPMREQINWYRDEEGYLWPVPAEGRVAINDKDFSES